MTGKAISDLLDHLDDETEWETESEFWDAWSPRMSGRLKSLLEYALALTHAASAVSAAVANMEQRIIEGLERPLPRELEVAVQEIRNALDQVGPTP